MAEATYKPASKVDWASTEAYSQFKVWRKEVERICKGPFAKMTDEVKVHHIFIWAGGLAEEWFDSKVEEDPDIPQKTPQDVLEILEGCLTHSTSFREARREFFRMEQDDGENTQAYYARLIKVFKRAKYGDAMKELLVDKLIEGCRNKDCQKKLMSKKAGTAVTECLDVMRKHEAVDHSMKQRDSASVNEISTQKFKGKGRELSRNKQKSSNHPKVKDGECTGCGKQARDGKPPHDDGERCRAEGQECNYCHDIGHFARVCWKKRGRQQQSRRQNAMYASCLSSWDESSDDDFSLGN